MSSSVTIEARRQALNNILKSDVESLLSNEIIRDLEHGHLKPDQVWKIFSQYRHYCLAFTGFLEVLLKRSSSPVVQKPLLENLLEERGGSDPTKNHVTMLENFVSAWALAIGKNENEARSFPAPLKAVSNFLRDIQLHLETATISSALGFIGPGTEEITSEQYLRFVRGLKSYGLVESSELAFFEAHVDLDIHHANLFWQALEQVAQTDSDWREVAQGARHSLFLEKKFWKELMEEI